MFFQTTLIDLHFLSIIFNLVLYDLNGKIKNARKSKIPMQKHDSADEVETEEHGEGESHVIRHPLRPHLTPFVGELGGP